MIYAPGLESARILLLVGAAVLARVSRSSVVPESKVKEVVSLC